MAEPEPATATVGALRAEISGWEKDDHNNEWGSVVCRVCTCMYIKRAWHVHFPKARYTSWIIDS